MKLFVDILNYADSFFVKKSPFHKIDYAFRKIKAFANAAKASEIDMTLFIDAKRKTPEAIGKWKKRRENEMKRGVQYMPQSMDVLLADSFRANGIPVLYSTEVDNDDALAAFAHHQKGSILSADKDFYRYRNSEFEVYRNFQIKEKKLHLTSSRNMPIISGLESRNLLSKVPKMSEKVPKVVELVQHCEYRRGTGSPLAKKLGNPHLQVRPLRQALYYRLGIKAAVLETLPVWRNNGVIWTEEKILADEKLDPLLDDPKSVINWMSPFPIQPRNVSDKDWNKHLFCLKTIALEYCVMANPEKFSLLELMLSEYKRKSADALLIEHIKLGKPLK
eukprot:NODE_391_length_8148_cov_0.393838.p2 type:complete len:333 gc:universal NODE_391_length_8148_cov_0.393838:5036-4038(-)